MPIYDFKCAEHGLFHELVSMDKAGEAFPCPKCQASCAPVILVAPTALSMSPAARQSAETNEAARHQPIISTQDSRAEAEDRHQFALLREGQGRKASHCGCSEHRQEQSALKQQVVLLPDGSKVFPSQRPWMISH
ncbi:FmdB family zinc ribbon protein [Marinomonas posidonica]|uniref:Regulatory protein, FmdB family n=1 Tax=Marinomonas posidonica (strain CECT 7376 / NCIMB 14433 / IVIA-Po-181) TaxID=491952 RepID=F6D0A8_MARPP|nr:zinc ribbon domain-containing protein [Marinomonas posidonica]AEF53630.1 regulatory protein, FmdB family [Marinomonas posidonica IVIA-Po-181]